MKLLLTLVLGLSVCLASWAEGPSDRTALQGKWVVTRWDNGTQVVRDFTDTGLTAIITADTFTFTATEFDQGLPVTSKKVSKYTLDMTKTPAQISLVPGSGSKKDKTIQGIFEVKGDTLRLCLNRQEGDPPAGFTPTRKCVLMEFKREKEKK